MEYAPHAPRPRERSPGPRTPRRRHPAGPLFLIGLIVFGGALQFVDEHDHDRLRQAGHLVRRAPPAGLPPRHRGGRPPAAAPADTTDDMIRMYDEEDKILKLKQPARDKRTGKVLVSIDRAIAIVAKKGLPHRDSAPKGVADPEYQPIPRRPGPTGRPTDARNDHGPRDASPRPPIAPSRTARRRPWAPARAGLLILAAVAALAWCRPGRRAQPGGVLKDVAFDQNLDTQIPLTLPFTDERGPARPAGRLLRQAAGDPRPGLQELPAALLAGPRRADPESPAARRFDRQGVRPRST